MVFRSARRSQCRLARQIRDETREVSLTQVLIHSQGAVLVSPGVRIPFRSTGGAGRRSYIFSDRGGRAFGFVQACLFDGRITPEPEPGTCHVHSPVETARRKCRWASRDDRSRPPRRRDYVECQATDLEAHEDKPGPWQQAHRAEFASLLVDPSHAKRVWRGLIEEGVKPLSRLKLG